MRGRWVFLTALIMIQAFVPSLPGACAGEPDAAEQREDADGPPLELLEFLGEWENRDGEWMDPLELEDWPIPDQERQENEDSNS